LFAIATLKDKQFFDRRAAMRTEYRKLKFGEIKKPGDELNEIGSNYWTPVDSELGGRVSASDAGWEYRRPLKSKVAVATVKQQAKGCRKAKLPKR
jgi:hypothetical protein